MVGSKAISQASNFFKIRWKKVLPGKGLKGSGNSCF